MSKIGHPITVLMAIAVLVPLLSGCEFILSLLGKPVETTIYSDAALDGVVAFETPEAGNSYSLVTDGSSASIGDRGDSDADGFNDGVLRLLLSFNLEDIPPEAEIISATLRVYQNADSSGSSYGEASLGSVLMTNIHFDSGTAAADLWNAATTGSQIADGPIAETYAANTWHEFDVLISAQDEFSEYRNRQLQFRLFHHYESNGDNSADTDGWNTGDAAENRPELVIVYRM